MNEPALFHDGDGTGGYRWARRTAVAASDQVNVGIIGVGGRGRNLLDSYGKIDGVNVKYICDADKASLEKAQAVARSWAFPSPPK